jgi:Flp pilus assembly pilin Flp
VAAYPGSSTPARTHTAMGETDTNTAPDEQSPSRREAGQALAEYALILAFVSITAIALTPVGQWVAVRLNDLAAAI